MTLGALHTNELKRVRSSYGRLCYSYMQTEKTSTMLPTQTLSNIFKLTVHVVVPAVTEPIQTVL